MPLLVEEVLCLDVSLVDDIFLLAGTDFIRDLVPWLSALCPDFFFESPSATLELLKIPGLDPRLLLMLRS